MPDHAEIASIEKFELMSAYLDGEVTASERQQVENWLQHDAMFKAQYQRMQGMQQAVSHLLVPEPVVPVTVLADQVFAKIAERRQSRWLKIGGAAVAATLVAVGTGLSGIWGGSSNAVPQLAKLSLPTAVLDKLEIIPNPAPMMVALNNSIVNIPQSPNQSAGALEDGDLGLLDALDTGDDI